MLRWAYHVGSHSQQKILSVVTDHLWQRFRESLKGAPTEEKLQRLEQYLKEQNFHPDARVRVDNYINALKRGGQLDMDLRVQR